MGIEVLGPLRMDGREVPMQRRDQVVLLALAARAGDVMNAEQLAEALWGEEPPASWSKILQGCIVRLRRTLGADVIETTQSGYRLAPPDGELDSQRFEHLIERGRALVAAGEPDRATVTFSRALELWRGTPFDLLDGWPPGRIELARLEELRRAAEESLLDAKLEIGEHREVVGLAEGCVANEPLREHRWATLALALYRCGRQAEALRALKSARRVLVEQLGIEPGPELLALEAAILRQDDSLNALPRPPAISERCPYKGLAPYDVEDTETFFGRAGEVEACLERLRSSPLLVVTGPSGSGKSSLVRAGLLPMLMRAGNTVAVFVPGSDPEAAMTNAVAASSGTPVVVVDQFEELFTLDDENKVRAKTFSARLVEYAMSTGPVVVAVRADHVAALAVDPAFARLAEQGMHLVTPLIGDALREAIEGPAALAGLRLEHGLVDLLVRDCEGEPGSLPLLSHALAETWQRRDGRVLTVEAYRSTGEIRGAVARSADRLYESLPAEQRPKLRSMLLRLVSPSPDGEPVRSRVATRSLGGDAERERVLGLLVRARLVTAEEDSVELAHEALARAWPRLRSWLDEDAAGQRILRHLAATADGWESLGRPATELYRGSRLDAALEWRDSSSPDLTAEEQAFLDASVAAAASEREQLAERARVQQRQNRRLRRSLVSVAILLVAAILGGAVAYQQRANAKDKERESALTALTSNAAALRTNRRDLAALLAVEAHRMAPSAATESALFGTFTAAPGAARVVHTDISLSLTVGSAAYLPDGERVVLGDGHGGVHLLDLATEEVEELPGLSDRFGWPLVDVAADGRYVVAAWRPLYEPETGLLTVWDLETKQQRFAPVTIPFRIGDVELSPDGSKVVASGGYDGTALIFDGATGDLRIEVENLPRPAANGNVVVTAAVAFTPDGLLAIGSMAGPIRFVDPDTGEERRRIDAAPYAATGEIIFSGDGTTFLAAGGGMDRFDVETGESLWGGDVPTERCNAYTVAERIGAVLCGEWTGRVVTFDLETGAQVGGRFDSHLGQVCALEVSPDGNRLVEVAGCSVDEVAVMEWRLDGGGPVSELVAATTGDYWVDQFDGDVLVAGYPDRGDDTARTHRIDLTNGEEAEAFPDVYGLIPTADPNIAAAIFDDGESPPTVGLYDVDRHEPVGTAVDPGIAFDRMWSDGRRAIVYGWEEIRRDEWIQLVRSIDLVAGEVVEPSFDFEPGLFFADYTAIAFAGDVFYVSYVDQSGDRDINTIQRRDLATGEVLTTSPPGFQHVATGGGIVIAATVDGRLAELDPETLAPVGTPFPGTTGPIGLLDIDRSGERLLVNADYSLRFYDIATRTPLGDPIDTDLGWANAALRDDGLVAAAATGFGIVTWDLDPSNWESAACQLAGRNLTLAEWEQYIGDLAPYRRTCEQFAEG